MNTEGMSIEFYLLGVVVIVLGIVILRIKLKQFAKHLRYKKRIKRGEQGEKEAEKYLKKCGFKILESQKEYKYTLRENGNEVEIPLVLDFVVSKNNKEYIIEVKTGSSAPNIKNAYTRRQVLEYYCALGFDGIYLLDIDTKDLKKIEFDFFIENKTNKSLWIAISILVLAVMFTSFIFLKIFVAILLLLIMYKQLYIDK